jgi:hypothetical protein
VTSCVAFTLLFPSRSSRSPVGTLMFHSRSLPAQQHHHRRNLVVSSSSQRNYMPTTFQPSPTRARMQSRPGRPGQDRFSPTYGIYEHPTREQDRQRDPPSIIWRASTCPTSHPPILITGHVDDRTSRRSHKLVRCVARTPPRIQPEKGCQAEERVRAALPYGHDERCAPSRRRRAVSASELRLPLQPPHQWCSRTASGRLPLCAP